MSLAYASPALKSYAVTLRVDRLRIFFSVQADLEIVRAWIFNVVIALGCNLDLWQNAGSFAEPESLGIAWRFL